ncbi:hypothetical protein [uncultured Shewanella sp.]|uniref:hypothetical protein n=1 Tax=uncultured Shewanella sp. TaxID=173975 RepID=UPI00261052AA|nr:hypothetical protein [uncultured Shewanella sp.]
MRALNTLLNSYDGDENGFITAKGSVSCPTCSKTNEFVISDGISASKVDISYCNKVLANIPHIKEIRVGDSCFYKVNGLPVQFHHMTCAECGELFTAVVGAGEYQSCRYMAVLVKVVIDRA